MSGAAAGQNVTILYLKAGEQRVKFKFRPKDEKTLQNKMQW